MQINDSKNIRPHFTLDTLSADRNIFFSTIDIIKILNSGTALTICFWAKREDRNGGFLFKMTSDNGLGSLFGFTTTNNDRGSYSNITGFLAESLSIQRIGNSRGSSTNWNHYAVTITPINGQFILKWYFNGYLQNIKNLKSFINALTTGSDNSINKLEGNSFLSMNKSQFQNKCSYADFLVLNKELNNKEINEIRASKNIPKFYPNIITHFNSDETRIAKHNFLIKNSGVDGFNADVNSVESYSDTEMFIEPNSMNHNSVVGMSQSNQGINYTTIDFSMNWTSQLRIYENSAAQVASFSGRSVLDTYSIQKTPTQIIYKRNGVALRTVSSTNPLIVDAKLDNVGNICGFFINMNGQSFTPTNKTGVICTNLELINKAEAYNNISQRIKFSFNP